MAQQAHCPLCQGDALTQSIWDPMVTRVLCEVCGEYDISLGLGTQGMDQRLKDIGRPDDKHLLSALTRQASDRGRRTVIGNDSILALLASAPRLTVLDQMDRALLYMAEHQQRADEHIAAPVGTDWPLIFAKDGHEFEYFLETLAHRGFLESTSTKVGHITTAGLSYRLTPEGWQKAEELRKSQPDSDQAFVAMWFNDNLTAAYTDGFKSALESVGYKPVRMDLVEHNDRIDDRIVAEIRRSSLLVADLTGNRGEVYFEAGLALGLGMPVIWTCKDTDLGNVHFDTAHYNFVVWAETADLKDKLLARIEGSIPGRLRRQA